MAIRRIVIQGDDRLGKRCRPVTDFNKRLHDLLDDMKETLAEAQGAGLAAPQAGVLRRAVVIAGDGDDMLELVNPEILEQSGQQTSPEGCLSVPGKWGMVTRPNFVRIRAQDRYGEWFEAEGEELMARCFCHELEHLDGHMYDEHVDRLYTSEEMDAILSEEQEPEEENSSRKHARRRVGRRRG